MKITKREWIAIIKLDKMNFESKIVVRANKEIKCDKNVALSRRYNNHKPIWS